MDTTDVILQNTGEAIAAVALMIYIVSLAATIIEIYQHRVSQLHAIDPVCVIYSTGFGDRFAIVVQNIGAGTLITRSLKFYDKSNSGTALLGDLVPRSTNGFYLIDHARGNNFAVASGEERIVVELKGDPDRVSAIHSTELLRERLREITMELVFDDVYSHPLPKVIYKLENFGKKIPMKLEVSTIESINYGLN